MIRPVQILRFLSISRHLLRFGLNRSVMPKGSGKWRMATYLNPLSFRSAPSGRGESLCEMLEKLGPVFIKFGQMLSTRQDLLPDDVSSALAKLQDAVAPFSGKQALSIIADQLDEPIDSIFSHVEEEAMAAASIAQVHAATLKTGEEVVIKVLRPQIKKIIRHDLALMFSCAKLVQNFSKRADRLDLVGLIQEFEYTILAELDLTREASNAAQLRRNFEGDKKLYIPAVFWAYSTPKMMVMERIYGVRISNVAELKEAGTDLQKLAENGIEIFFTQVLRDSFFHADMHPGNLFVDIKDPKNPIYLGVDFGIMGTLGTDDQFYLAKNLLAFFRRDYRRVAKLHVECGWVPRDTRVDQFESAIRAVSEPIFQRPLGDISFAQLLMRLFKTAEQFHMRLQPQLLLLQKTLLNIEALGRQLYPELDLWATAHPFLERWLREKHSVLALGKTAVQDFPAALEKILATPELLHDALQVMTRHQGAPTVKLEHAKKRSGRARMGFGLGIIAMTAAGYFTHTLTLPILWVGLGVGVVSLFSAACAHQ